MPSRFCFVHCCGILFRPSLSAATSISSETPLLKNSHEILRLWDSLPFWSSVAVWIFWSFRTCYPKVSKSQLSHCIFFCSGTLGTLPGFLRTSTVPTMSTMSYHFFILTVLTVLTVSHPKRSIRSILSYIFLFCTFCTISTFALQSANSANCAMSFYYFFRTPCSKIQR